MITELVIRSKNNVAITSSLKVAEKFEMEHKNVLRAIENLLHSNENMTAQNCAVHKMFHKTTYSNLQNKEQPMYYMNRDGFTLLAMGFTGKKALQFKLEYIAEFNRQEELIKELLANPQPQFKLPQTYLEALEELVVKEKKLIEANNTIEEQKPKVELFDRLMDADKLYSISEVAKMFGTGQKRLFAKLRELEIFMLNNIPYQRYMDYFEVKEVEKNERFYTQTFVKPKGINYLSKKIN